MGARSRKTGAGARAAAWYVYMLECAPGHIYTGVTPDVAARFATHRAGRGGAFTRSHPPRRVLAAQRCRDRSAALVREAQLKKLSRAQKLAWAARRPWPRAVKRVARGARRA